MPFKRIDYLTWYRKTAGTCRIDLSNSCISPVSREELSLSIESLDLARGCRERSTQRFRETLAKRYGVGAENIAITSGATTGYYILFAAMLDQGNDVLLEAPNYEPLYRLPVHFRTYVRTIERDFDRRFQIDLEQVERKISKNTKAIIMTNLHNPTGVSTNPEKMMTIGQLARDYRAYVVCGEVYLDNAFESHHRPAATFGDNMISVSSFSKAYGFPGLRIGWVVADEGIIRKMHDIADYVTGGEVSIPSLSIAEVVWEKRDALLERSRRIVSANLKTVEAWAAKRTDVSLVSPEGGTVCFLRIPQRLDSVKLSQHLISRYQTIVVPGEFFWEKKCLRIALGGENALLAEGLNNLDSALNDLLSIR